MPLFIAGILWFLKWFEDKSLTQETNVLFFKTFAIAVGTALAAKIVSEKLVDQFLGTDNRTLAKKAAYTTIIVKLLYSWKSGKLLKQPRWELFKILAAAGSAYLVTRGLGYEEDNFTKFLATGLLSFDTWILTHTFDDLIDKLNFF